MSSSGTRKGRHAAPSATVALSERVSNASAGRRIAATAAAIAAGALPLAGAASACAATAAPDALPLPDPPNLGLPSGLSDSIDPLRAAVPLAPDLPLSQVAGAAAPVLGDVARAGTGARSAEARSARGSAEVPPLHNADLMPRLAATSGTSLQQVPQVLHEGALGELSAQVTPPVNTLTGDVADRAAPVAARLRQAGVPTVGSLTGKLSDTPLPMVGNVGGLTRTLPVTDALGAGSPVTTALGDLGSL